MPLHLPRCAVLFLQKCIIFPKNNLIHAYQKKLLYTQYTNHLQYFFNS